MDTMVTAEEIAGVFRSISGQIARIENTRVRLELDTMVIKLHALCMLMLSQILGTDGNERDVKRQSIDNRCTHGLIDQSGLTPRTPDAAPFVGTLHGHERALIIRALEECGWNQTRAANKLDITRDHLRHRLRKYGIKRPSDFGRK